MGLEDEHYARRWQKEKAVFPPSCQDPSGTAGKKPSSIPRIVVRVSHRALTPRSNLIHCAESLRSVSSRQRELENKKHFCPASMAGPSHRELAEACGGLTPPPPPGLLPLLGAGLKRLFAPAATLPSDAGFLPFSGFSEPLSSTSALALGGSARPRPVGSAARGDSALRRPGGSAGPARSRGAPRTPRPGCAEGSTAASGFGAGGTGSEVCFTPPLAWPGLRGCGGGE